MRTTEGRGRIAPAPVRVRLVDAELELAKTTAKDRAVYRRYDARPDVWGRGLHTDGILGGTIGEFAVASWCSVVTGQQIFPDTDRRASGDGGVDLWVAGYPVQVKTAVSNYDDLLLPTWALAEPSWEVVIRARWPSRLGREASGGLFDAGVRFDVTAVDLCGWLFLDEFRRHSSPPQPARRGTHFNYAVCPELLKPMNDFAELCEAKLRSEQLGGYRA